MTRKAEYSVPTQWDLSVLYAGWKLLWCYHGTEPLLWCCWPQAGMDLLCSSKLRQQGLSANKIPQMCLDTNLPWRIIQKLCTPKQHTQVLYGKNGTCMTSTSPWTYLSTTRLCLNRQSLGKTISYMSPGKQTRLSPMARWSLLRLIQLQQKKKKKCRLWTEFQNKICSNK